MSSWLIGTPAIGSAEDAEGTLDGSGDAGVEWYSCDNDDTVLGTCRSGRSWLARATSDSKLCERASLDGPDVMGNAAEGGP